MSSFSKCVVCTDPESEDNKVLRCNICNVRVHQMCYGIKTYKEKWKCAPCMVKTSGSGDPICELCLQYGGALKKTTTGNWAHVICGLFITGVKFENKKKMEPINISKIPDECRNKLCEFCLNDDGASCLCSAPDCNRWVHVTCAQKNACTKEITDKKRMITFLAYCENHMPSHRRISSVFVRDKLKEKCNEIQPHQGPTTIHESSDDSEQSMDEDSVNNATESKNVSGDNEIQRHHEEPTANHESSDSGSEQSIDKDSVNNASGSHNVSGDSHQSITSRESITSNGSTLASNLSNESIDSNNYHNVSGLGNSIGGNDDDTNKHINVSNIDDTNSENTNEVNSPIDNSIAEDDELNNDDSNAPEYWWDHQELLVQLLSKDKKIAKLKEKKTKLKDQLTDLRDENLNLQMQIQELNAKLQKGLVLTKNENMNACCSTSSDRMDDVLNILENRTTTQLSNDGSKLNFPNGVKIKADLARRLEIIPSEESLDRKFVNESFELFFSEKYIEKQIRNGCAKEQLLTQFRDSGRYETMKDLYELRVRRNGRGNVDSRVGAFKNIFRSKLNNWIQKYEKKTNKP